MLFFRSRSRRIVVALPLLLLGCQGGRDRAWAGEAKAELSEPVVVEVTTPGPATISRSYRSSGTLEPLRAAEIVAVQPGIVRRLLAEEGDVVQQDQPLAELDGRTLQLEAAKASLQVRSLEHEMQRLQSLAKRNAVSQEELDKQTQALSQARATAKLSHHQATLSLVRAPFSGTITRRRVDVGNLATGTTALFSLADLGGLRVQLHVPEREAAAVAVGAPVRLELIDGSTISAKVVRRAPIVEATTGTVKLTVETAEKSPAAVPGAFVRAEVVLDSREVGMALAKSAVFELEGKSHVYRIVEGKAKRTPVELGLKGEQLIEIVSGLDKSSAVVRDARSGVSEGAPVKTLEQPTAAAAAAGSGA